MHIVAKADWIEARRALLAQGKGAGAAARPAPAPPWLKVENSKVFDAPDDEVTMADRPHDNAGGVVERNGRHRCRCRWAVHA
jgi:hypothetical protein